MGLPANALDGIVGLLAHRLLSVGRFPTLLSGRDFVPGRIVLANSSLVAGGAERQVVYTLEGLSRTDAESVSLICIHLHASPEYRFYLDHIQSTDIEISELCPVSRLRDIGLRLKFAFWSRYFRAYPSDIADSMRRFMLEFLIRRPQVVHAWQDWLSITAGLAAVMVGVPVVVVSGRNVNPTHFDLHRSCMHDVYRLLLRSKRVRFTNNSVAGSIDYARWLGVPADRITTLRNAIDETTIRRADSRRVAIFRQQLSIQPCVPVVGGVFRLAPEKDPLLWISAMAHVAAKRPDVRFLLVGAGPMEAAIRAAVKSLGLDDRVHMPGLIEDVSLPLSLMSAFVLTSHQEGIPNVLLEAGLVGVPVVTTRAGGAPETVDTGRTGWVVDSRDPALIAERILYILDNGDWAARAAALAPDFIRERFGMQRMIAETIAVYGIPLRMLPKPAAADEPPGTSVDPSPEVFRAILADRPRGSDYVPRRIALICSTLGPGGAERQIVNTVIGLSRQDIESVQVLCASLDPGTGSFFEPVLRRNGIGARAVRRRAPAEPGAAGEMPGPLAKHGAALPADVVQDITDAYWEFKEIQPEVVHTWLDWYNVRAGIAAALAGVPRIVISGRSVNPSYFPLYTGFMNPAYRALAELPNVVFTNNSHAGAEDYAAWMGVRPERIQVIYNGVHFPEPGRASAVEIARVREQLGIPPRSPLVGGMLRFYPEKRPLLWIEAAAQIAARQPEAQFVIWGAGALRDEMLELASGLGIRDRLRLPGTVEDVMAALSAIDLLLHTSYVEGTSNVLLEAQWVGTPVVATAGGGTAEAVDPGRSGWIVDSADAAAIASQVSRLLDDAEARRACLVAGPDFIRRRFGLERMIAEIMAVYGFAPTHQSAGAAEGLAVSE